MKDIQIMKDIIFVPQSVLFGTIHNTECTVFTTIHMYHSDVCWDNIPLGGR